MLECYFFLSMAKITYIEKSSIQNNNSESILFVQEGEDIINGNRMVYKGQRGLLKTNLIFSCGHVQELLHWKMVWSNFIVIV